MKYKPYNLKDVVKGFKQNKFTVVSTFYIGGPIVLQVTDLWW